MGKYLKLFNTHAEYQAFTQTSDFIKPNVSHCVNENHVHYNPIPYDYSKNYLTFVALEDGTFQLSTNAVSYSLDNGETWTTLAAATASPTVTAGNKIMWKGEMTPQEYVGIGTFSATGNFDVQGNVMSLLYGDNYKGQTDLTGKAYAFYRLFSGNKKIINAENLSLPATTLAERCYYNMFEGCLSLVTAPELPATTLADSCYGGMFSICTSLTTAPELPATTLTQSCYTNMFYGCTALTTAPDLPALTLVNYCYYNMFNGCSSLNYIKAMFTTTPSGSSPNYYTQSWVSGVASSGTFVKNSAAQWNVTGINGIPTGWTVVTE